MCTRLSFATFPVRYHILDVQQRYSCSLEVIIYSSQSRKIWKQSCHTIHKATITLLFPDDLILSLNCSIPVIFRYGSPIVDIKWHESVSTASKNLITSDSHVVRIWDPQTVSI